MILAALVVLAAPPDFDALATDYRAVMSSLVAADTTNPPGNEARAVSIIAARLKKEGIAVEVTDFAPGRTNLVARLPGKGDEKPLMLLAHTDVVGVEGQAWSTPPHTVTEKDGYLYGRGVRDDLSLVVGNLELFIQLKRQGVKLRRDVLLVLTGDEESGGLGLRKLLEQKPELANTGLVLNEGGSTITKEPGSTPFFVSYEVVHKIYRDFAVTTTGTTGHASVPRKDNAIYKLARALSRVEGADAPPRLIPVMRAYFKARAPLEDPQTAKAMLALADAPDNALPRDALAQVEKNPILAAQMRTTCVATMLSAGTKVNALPPSARANLNCRILPDETVEALEQRLKAVIADPEVTITPEASWGAGPPSPLTGEFVDALKKVVGETWPKVPVIPVFGVGTTDSRFTREKGIASYGFSPFPGLEADGPRSHGIDERVPVKSIRQGLELYWKLILELSQAK
ncbi:MAG: M20/M25/M40 family metallo-hydrolase [Myxococcota bacterium]|nr:M20/M25/M40 family metallo-hydrolase [Myxococcota bacterium]